MQFGTTDASSTVLTPCALPVQDSIGGNAKTVIIANVSPSVSFLAETMSTLGFATRARKLVNKVSVCATAHYLPYARLQLWLLAVV